jgi:hypothetical protein
MTITIRHSKVDPFPDLNIPGVVQPSDWNADHAVTVAPPQVTSLLTGAGTYTPPAGAAYLVVELQGPGSGGAGSGTTPGAVSAPASSTTFTGTVLGTLTALKGNIPTTVTGGAVATASGGDTNVDGQRGGDAGSGYTFASGGVGGGVGGGKSHPGQVAGDAANANSGGGGGGAGSDATASPGAGGGGGAYLKKIVTIADTSYSYNVGPGSAGGTLGTGGAAGGAGAAGRITITACFV